MKLKKVLLYILTGLTFTACKEDVPEYEKLTDSKERVKLYIVKGIEGGESLTVFPQNDSRTTSFSVNYGGVGLPAQDINLSIAIDYEAIDSVNRVRQTLGLDTYEVMPSDAYTLDKELLVIKAGAQNSDYVTLNYNSNLLSLDKKYILAFKVTDDKGYTFATNGNRVIFYGEVVESELSKAKWSATVSSSATQAGDNGGAAALIDGNANTFWHSPYNPLVEWPHYATINFGSIQFLTKVKITIRHDSGAGAPKAFDFQTSEDGLEFKTVRTFTNTSNLVKDEVVFDLDETVKTQYVRLFFKNGFNSSYMNLAEIGFIGF